ncbi:hypothetical protein ACJX0J_019806, partial [Zea mays]
VVCSMYKSTSFNHHAYLRICLFSRQTMLVLFHVERIDEEDATCEDELHFYIFIHDITEIRWIGQIIMSLERGIDQIHTQIKNKWDKWHNSNGWKKAKKYNLDIILSIHISFGVTSWLSIF